MSQLRRVAGAQIDIRFADVPANLARIEQVMDETSQNGAWLTVFPEAAVTGYCFESVEEARPFAETIPGPTTERLGALCQKLGLSIVVGMLERDGDQLFNSAALISPQGLVGSYRKIHLPYLGVDRFVEPGNRPFGVWTIDDVRIGMHICYDGSFPESARSMALDGADLIVLPTNWPPRSECAAAHLANIRAHENIVYYMTCNRVGEERGFRFIGTSQIADPAGETMSSAPGTEEAIFYAEIDIEKSRRKKLIRVPGKHEIDRIQDRRPELYGRLVEPLKRSPASPSAAG